MQTSEEKATTLAGSDDTAEQVPVVAPDIFPVVEKRTFRASRLGLSNADGMVLLCVSLWAINVPTVKLVLGYFEPIETSILRFLTGGIVFAIYVQLREGSLRIERRHLGLLAAAGFMGIALNQVLFVYALKNTTSSEVSLLFAATPSFATLLAWVLGQEKIKLNYWLSLPIAVAGVSLIVLTAPSASLAGNLFGDFLALMSAFTWATYTVMIRPLLKHYSAARISAYVLIMGGLMLVPPGFNQFNWSRMVNVPLNIWLGLLYSAVGAVLVTNILWYTGVKVLGAPRTAFYAYLQPFLGVLAAALILGETIVPWQIVGGGLVVASMVLYRVRLGKR